MLLKDILTAGSQLKIEGHYAFDPTVYAVEGGIVTAGSFAANNPNIANPTPGSLPIVLEWAAGAGYAQAVGKLGFAVSGKYGETFDTTFFVRNAANQVVPFTTSGDYYALVGNVGYQITNNFSTLAEVSYRNVDFGGPIGDTDQVAGFLSFQRNF